MRKKKDIFKEVNTILSDFLPLKKPLLVAVSGGVDSMVLAHVLINSKIAFEVAHVNYCLRNEESNLDEALVQTFCKEQHIMFHSLKIDTLEYSAINKLGIQEAARNIRYNWFEKLNANNTYEALLTAHHLEDNIETFLINSLRGSGIKGLKAMSIIDTKRSIVRPLLAFTKKEMYQYATLYKVPYREDASNQKTDYLRNAIRHKVIPNLAVQNNDFYYNMQLTITNLQCDFSYLEQQLAAAYDQKIIWQNTQAKLKNYKEEHPRFLLYCLEKFGFNATTLKNLLNVKHSGKLFLSSNFILNADRHDIMFEKKCAETHKNVPQQITLGEHIFNNQLQLKITEEQTPIIDINNNKVAWLDAQKLEFPLKIRTWQPTDKIVPIGMKGKKKISDLLTDLKVPIWEKKTVTVLISNNEIVWVIGYRISENFKISEKTKKFIKIETSCTCFT